MNFNTGRYLKDGTEIRLGDKLKGSQTHEVVVLRDNDKIGVQVIKFPDHWFDLDHFLEAWSDLKRIGSIIEKQINV